MSWIKSIDEVGSGDRISVGKLSKVLKRYCQRYWRWGW